MADLARALQTPVPATQPAPQQSAPQGTGEKAAVTRADNVARDAKNERDRLRRKAQRAADAKAAHLKAVETALAKKKKRKSKRKSAKQKAAALTKAWAPKKKVRGRGRPPGSKNKPKVGLAVALVPAPGVLPRDPKTALDLLTQIGAAVSLLNAMPEHARKVVLDAVK